MDDEFGGEHSRQSLNHLEALSMVGHCRVLLDHHQPAASVIACVDLHIGAFPKARLDLVEVFGSRGHTETGDAPFGVWHGWSSFLCGLVQIVNDSVQCAIVLDLGQRFEGRALPCCLLEK